MTERTSPSERQPTASRTPEIPDPYLGTVWGNILDQYDNPSYNLRLYMRRVGENASVAETDNTGTADSARSDTPQTIVVTGIRDIKQVTIAQTGVTGNIIDDLEIESAVDKDGGFLTQGAKFRIFQPGGANLLDQIAAADIYAGNQVSTSPIMYLEIRFQGYNSDPDDNDVGGDTTTIYGPITFKCKLKKIAVRVDNAGSYYDFEVTLEHVQAFTDTYYRLPFALTTVGKTITEHVKHLESQLNKYNADNSSQSYENPDEIKFDLTGLVGDSTGATGFEGGAPTKIKDENLNTSNDLNAEDVNRAWTNETKETVEEEQSSSEEVPKNTGKTDIVVVGDKISVPKGVSIERYFFILLSMNKEFLSMITRKAKIEAIDDDTVNRAKTFISWMRMNSQVQELRWDKKRGAYTRRITYKPTIYNTGRTDIGLTIEETNPTANEAVATTKLNDLYVNKQLQKSYYYLFTGKNDQIINLDIAYDGAQVLLVPPNGGVIADVSLSSAVALNSTIAQTADASGKELFNKAKVAGAKAKFGDLLNSIKDSTNSIKAVADAINRPQDTLATILKDTTGKAQRELIASLDSRTITKLASSAVMSNTSSSDTAPPAGTTPSGAAYTPEKSGIAYAEDLVMSSDAIDVKDLNKFDVANADFRYEVLGTTTVPNIAESATYVTTSSANTLFGYVYQQHTKNAFLLNVNLTLRGDPWYLGKGPNEKEMAATSSPNTISYTSGDNYFLLQIATAQSYDPDVIDEDSPRNSGFMNFDGMSKSFSGLYRIKTVKNYFRNGVYTVEVSANKEMAIPLHKIRRYRLGEKKTDFTKVADYDKALVTTGAPIPTDPAPTDPGGPLGDPNLPTLVGTPPPAGKDNMPALYNWIRAQGATPDENGNFPDPDGFNPRDHQYPGPHSEGRAFDVNFGTNGRGVYEATDSRYSAKMDAIAAALRQQGWTVIWREKDHFDHLHVHHKPGQ
jgi:hypothetical protein